MEWGAKAGKRPKRGICGVIRSFPGCCASEAKRGSANNPTRWCCPGSLSSISQTDYWSRGDSPDTRRTRAGHSPWITLGLPGAPPAAGNFKGRCKGISARANPPPTRRGGVADPHGHARNKPAPPRRPPCQPAHGGVADPQGHARNKPTPTINPAHSATPGARSFGQCPISRHIAKTGGFPILTLFPGDLS